MNNAFIHPLSGDMGIGTIAPVAKLHVEGDIHTSGLITASNIRVLGDYVILDTITSNTEQIVITNDGTGPALKVTQTGNNSIAEFYDDGNALAFKVANDGLIGIGTATPQAKLHVVGSVKATASISSDTQFLGQASDTATAPSFSFTADPTTGMFQPAPSNLAVTTNGTERMRVLANGNVGIGTTDPSEKLHVDGNVRVDGSASMTYSGTSTALIVNQQGTGKLFELQDAGVPRMTVLDGGYVGIGTTSPLQKLHVFGDTRIDGNFTAPQITGPQNAGVYVPQDFSSSALNVQAYVVGSVPGSSMGPFAGEGSMYFDGSATNFVNFGTATNGLWPGGGALTDGSLEFWFYQTQRNFNYIVTRNSSLIGTQPAWSIAQDSNGTTYFNAWNGTTTYTATSFAGLLNTWNHIAVTVKSNIMSVFMNGVLGGGGGVTATFSGTLGGSSSYLLAIGNLQNSASYTTYGYISNLRMVQGTALYTTSFTLPTAPLQPIQGVTQAGTPYGTVLLLRNAPAPGRVLTQKFAGANSSSVLAFPPGPMTGYSTTINAGYGQGVYVVSASSDNSGQYSAWQAFDKNNSLLWVASYSYTMNVPYAGSVVTIDANGTSYKGEWLQIQMPCAIVLASYSLRPQDGPANTPNGWYVLGSRNGINWYLIDTRAGQSWVSTVYNTYQIQSSQAFTHFRFVCYMISTNTLCSVSEWVLNGTIESVNITADSRVGLGVVAPVQALEVAGSAVFAGTVSSGTGLMFRNRIINGNFDVWQRGTSFNPANGGYMADRWRTTFNGTGATRTISQQTFPLGQLDVPGNPKYFIRFNQSVAGSGGGYNTLEQLIESVSTLAGMMVTCSFWGRVGSGSQTISALFRQAFGSGGTPSAPTDSYASPNFTLTTFWQKFTYTTFFPYITNKVLGSNNDDCVILYILLPTNTTFIIDISQVQVEQGTIASGFEYRPYSVELTMCQRYYQKFITYWLGLTYNSNFLYNGILSLKTTMRIPPSLDTGASFFYASGINVGTVALYNASAARTTTDSVVIWNSENNWVANNQLSVSLGLHAEL